MMKTVRETAATLRCSERTVWELISTGELESIRVGRLRRIPDESLAEFVEQRRTAEHSGGDAA